MTTSPRDLTSHPAAIVDASGAAILSVALNRKIRSWNPAAERLFGYTSKEALGADLKILIPEDRIKEAQESLARAMAGESFSVETVRRHQNGI